MPGNESIDQGGADRGGAGQLGEHKHVCPRCGREVECFASVLKLPCRSPTRTIYCQPCETRFLVSYRVGKGRGRLWP